MLSIPAGAASSGEEETPPQGTWHAVVNSTNGGASDQWVAERTAISFNGTQFETRVAGQVDRGTFHIWSDKEPAQIDFEFLEGAIAGKTRHGVFRLDKGDLYITMPFGTETRPTSLASEPGCMCAAMRLSRSDTAKPSAAISADVAVEKRPAFVESVTELSDGTKEIVVSGQMSLQGTGGGVQSINLRERLEQAAKIECKGAYEVAAADSIRNSTSGSGGPRFH